MNPSSLANLHQKFDQAFKNNYYLIEDKKTQAISTSTKKSIRLQEIFKIAAQQIQNEVAKISNPKEIVHEFGLLLAIEKDGELHYQRYCNATNTWKRSFLKALTHYTPDFLKRFLPRCFSNQMENAEKQTLAEYEEFKKTIISGKKTLTALKDQAEIHQDEKDQSEQKKLNLDEFFVDSSDKDLTVLTGAENSDAASKANLENTQTANPDFAQDEEEIEEELLQELIEETFNATESLPHDKITNPGKSESQHVDDHHSQVLVQDAEDLDDLQDIDWYDVDDEDTTVTAPQALFDDQESIDSVLLGIPDLLQELEQFKNRPLSLEKFKFILISLSQAVTFLNKEDSTNAQINLENVGINKDLYNLFSKEELIKSIIANNDQNTLDLLKISPWHEHFKEAIDQTGHIDFFMQKLGSTKFIQLKDQNQKPVQERAFSTYRGAVALSFNDKSKAENELPELIKFLKSNPKCTPCKIDISLNCELNAQILIHLAELSFLTAEIQIKGLKELDFKSLNLSEEDENKIIQQLKSIKLPHLTSLTLSDKPKNNWIPQNFSQILSICPTIELLKQMYQLCSQPLNIYIPQILVQKTTELDLTAFSVEQAVHLIQVFKFARSINLSGLDLKDTHLKNLVKGNHLVQAEVLNLKNCSNLTTDCLFALTKLKDLKRLSLPDLQKGTASLKNLQKFDDPFKIKLFYGSCKLTQRVMSHLYTGPIAWAALHQIPMARQGIHQIFRDKDKILDAKSVAYWIHANDYVKLEPQPSIEAIFADSNAELNDGNLVDFVSKFPNAKIVSLYNNPNITDAGIAHLVSKCPKIRILDLTGCKGISSELFYFGDNYLNALKKLEKLNVTDTSIDGKIKTQKEFKDLNLVYTQTSLKISDDQLTDDLSLENIMGSMSLSQIKRIDLSNCTKLTDEMLGKLLDRLNADMWVSTSDGLMEDNPQRLNLSVLDLSGCVNITDKAFQIKNKDLLDHEEDPNPTFKQLEILDRVIMDGTKISDSLQNVYPQTTFQQFDTPVLVQVEPKVQLQNLKNFYDKKQLATQGDQQAEREAKKLSKNLVHDRLCVELFANPDEDKELLNEMLNESIDPTSDEFSDFSFTFDSGAQSAPVIFKTHRDALLGQTLYFVNGFRPGGSLSKVPGITFQNPNKNASKTMQEVLLGSIDIASLDWKKAAEAAEPVGTANFNLLKSYYNALLKRIRSQFDLDNAEQLFLNAKMLKDTVSLNEYENTLIAYLNQFEQNMEPEAEIQFRDIAKLAKEFSLQKLQKKVTEIENKQTELLIQQNETERENEETMRLITDALAAQQLSQYYNPI